MCGRNRFVKLCRISKVIAQSHFAVLICLLIAAWLPAQAQTRSIIAVLNLKSDESVSPGTIRAICNKISQEIARDKNYNVFDRENLPFILEHLNLKYPLPCAQVQCYADVGSQIGADQIVGGAVSLNGGELRVELERVDVKKQRIIKKAHFARTVKKEEFMAKILQDMVKDLMRKEPWIAFFAKPPGLIGSAAIAAAAVVTMVLTRSKKETSGSEENDAWLPPRPSHSP